MNLWNKDISDGMMDERNMLSCMCSRKRPSKCPELNKEESQYEKCVMCHCFTSVKYDTEIHRRQGYIDGCGQLCEDCYNKLYQEISHCNH